MAHTASCPFFQQVRQEWEYTIQPIIEDVCGTIAQMVQTPDHTTTNLFRMCEPVRLYTKIYKLTTHPQSDFCHLDFLYNQEIQSLIAFCKRFQAKTLSEMNRHILGFQILLRWFRVFFHHLNRLRHRLYFKTHRLEEEMASTIRKHYIKPQEAVLSQLLCKRWANIRKNHYALDQTLMDSMDFLRMFHPDYYNDRMLFLYFKRLREHAQKKSRSWYTQDSTLSYMEKANQCFQQETKMFCDYFTEQHNDLGLVQAILKKIFTDPHGTAFLEDTRHGWKALLLANHLPDLQTAYDYFSRMDGCSLWLSLYQSFLEERITAFSQQAIVVEPLALLLKEQSILLEKVFTDEKVKAHFTTSLGKAIQKAITDHDHTAFHLAKTIHHHIPRKSSEQILVDLSALVAFCPEKDVFYEHYHHFLKTRLLMGRYYPPYEKMVIDIFCTKLGMSFVLNLRLMMEETHGNYLSEGCCRLNKLSSVVWKLQKEAHLQYRPPAPIRTILHSLHERMGRECSIRLEMLWTQGGVVLTRRGTDFYMSPVQGIVLLGLEEPATQENLAVKLQINNDTNHNLGGVLESLSKAMLVVEEKGVWSWCTPSHTTTRVIVPPVKKQNHLCSSPETTCPLVLEAFIVRTLKQAKRMKSTQLLSLVSKKYNVRLVDIQQRITKLIDGEFLSKEEDNTLCYIP